MRSTAEINAKIQAIQSATEIKSVWEIPDAATILAKNPHRNKLTGYFAILPLATTATYVPKVKEFKDRYKNDYAGGQFDAPLLTLQEWYQACPQNNKPELLINANWWNIWPSGVPLQDDKLKINPRKFPRTFLIGLSISEGELVSSHNTKDQGDVPLDVFIVDAKTKKAAVLSNTEFDNIYRANPKSIENKNAVAGFVIAKDSKLHSSPEANNNASKYFPRTGIGISQDQKNLIVIVIQNLVKEHTVTATEFANLFLSLGCSDVINLDNSGSVELLYHGSNSFGEKVKIQTKTCDTFVDQDGLTKNNSERPKPNFIGFRNTAKARFFARDDMDLRVNDEEKRRSEIVGIPPRFRQDF